MPTPRRPDPQPRHRAFTTRSLGGHIIRQSSYALASGGGFGLREGEDDDDDGLGLGTREDEESPHFCCVVCHPDRCANRVNRYACGVTPDRYFILFYLHYNLLSHLFLLVRGQEVRAPPVHRPPPHIVSCPTGVPAPREHPLCGLTQLCFQQC